MSRQERRRWALVAHGGASLVSLHPRDRARVQKQMDQVAALGAQILRDGGTSVECVEAVIRWFEDNPTFNAGLPGGSHTDTGKSELEASIMRGQDLAYGSVIGATSPHPITEARELMDGKCAPFYSFYGDDNGCFMHPISVAPASARSAPRSASRTRARSRTVPSLEVKEQESKATRRASLRGLLTGTVGCVALDQYGHLAAGTSSGGIQGKLEHRVGDSAIIGAGTYADDQTCAISCSGKGEEFVRYCSAYAVTALMRYGHRSLKEAADTIIYDTMPQKTGGLIALDREGHMAMPFNSADFLTSQASSDSDNDGPFRSIG